MDWAALGLFVVSATALLGSPGPGIASLVAIGRQGGFAQGLRFLAGLQLGLAIAAGASAAGLFTLLAAVPGVLHALNVVAAIYLVWLAWRIASAPVGETESKRDVAASFGAGFLLGIANPKAYIAFVSLFASQTLVASNAAGDAASKWLAVVLVMITVDVAWLYAGAVLRRAKLTPRGERALNIVLGLMIVGATLLSFA